MERDQERFYEDELEPREDTVAEQETDEVDDLKFFLELLKLIRMAINAGANVPLTNKKIIDADKCLRIIDDMEKNLPDAVQYGMKMYNERERLMTNAETTAMNRVTSAEMRANAALEKAKEEVSQRLADAENRAHDIIADAQERADHMLDESEIVRRAREEARIIKNDARVEANELRIKASQDAYKVLSAVEGELSQSLNTIRRRRAELGAESECAPDTTAPPRTFSCPRAARGVLERLVFDDDGDQHKVGVADVFHRMAVAGEGGHGVAGVDERLHIVVHHAAFAFEEEEHLRFVLMHVMADGRAGREADLGKQPGVAGQFLAGGGQKRRAGAAAHVFARFGAHDAHHHRDRPFAAAPDAHRGLL